VGKRTASGEPYRREVFSAAHRRLPLGALVTVRNPANQREVVVRINDRGPHTKGRIIGLSRKAAETLDVLEGDHMVQLLRQ
jgi:rare lipoprotein A